jgi:hypothetical protein
MQNKLRTIKRFRTAVARDGYLVTKYESEFGQKQSSDAPGVLVSGILPSLYYIQSFFGSAEI